MGEVEVLQCHGADIPGVRHLYLVLIALAVRPCLRPIAGLRGHGFGENVLLVKEGLKVALYLVNGEHPFMECRQNGDQHIGVVLNLVQIKVILVIVVGGLVGIQILPQFILFGAVGFFRRQHVGILGEIGGRHNVGHPAAEHGGTGLQGAQQHYQQKTDAAHDQRALPMPFQEKGGALGLLGGFLGRLCRGLRCFPGLGGLARRPVCRRILLLQLPFLPQAGDGIGCKLGVLRHGFPIVEIRIGLDRRLLRLCCVPPGFQLAFRPPVLDTAVSVAHSLLKAAFPQVARLDAGIFLLHLPDLAVDRCACLLNGAGQRISVLGRWRFGRDSGLCRVQPVRRLVRLADGPLQLRLGLVRLGKLQSGGWTARCRLALPIGSALFPALLFGCCLFPVQFHTVHRFSSGAHRVAGCRMVLLRRAVRVIGSLARDQVDGYRPVTGHLLRLLFGGFPFFQGASPPVP